MSLLTYITWLTLVMTAVYCKRHKEDCSDHKPSNNSKFDEKLSKEILQLYPGLFSTAGELKLQLDVLEASREKTLYDMGIDAAKYRRLPGDGDQCCATFHRRLQAIIPFINDQPLERFACQCHIGDCMYKLLVDTDMPRPEINYYTEYFLRDISGKCRFLVTLNFYSEEPMYQVVPRAKCVKYGHCTGLCIEEYITMTLLVWADPDADHGLSVEFEKFKLPAYCSCKNIT